MSERSDETEPPTDFCQAVIGEQRGEPVVCGAVEAIHGDALGMVGGHGFQPLALKPWPPSARHHHGFLRAVIFFPDTAPAPYATPWIETYVDGVRCAGNRHAVNVYDQRRDEWHSWYTARQDDLKGHPCLPPWRCAFVAMAEVLALAAEEGVDTSAILIGTTEEL